MISPIFLTLHYLVQAAEELAEMLVDTEYATCQELDNLIDSLVALEEANMTLAPPPLKESEFPAEWDDEEEEEDD